ncbi:hypothetical protein CVD28_13765 [Bacillus sp. M6-12]|uniref:hypothetical protein n=1 Tax=Bacillus sp. M6-12 TaxID=2054166 RepID=UPI000C76A2FB|nr:hypothetical protein [Bacillus sp. M6-12]PLS17116.1 hypothetical protein CVD28_13765 [Bacillus sp. M6-12]
MLKTTFLLVIFLILLTGPAEASTKIEFIEKYDSPISFKVEALPWDMANQIVPKGTVFTIIDVESGMQFKVQRRAGSQHADVQPLTKQDTKVMKKIYKGRWSWKRKAIIVLVNDQMIAASMHGMPHGAGALTNGFRGHFCIHFLGSTTHRSRKTDPLHKLMILKAGGKLDEYIDSLSPAELIDVFSQSVNMHDKEILKQTVAFGRNKEKLEKELDEISYLGITVLQPKKEEDGLILTELPAKVELKQNNKPKEKKVIRFVIKRDNAADRWFIDGDYLESELIQSTEKEKK